MSAATLEQDQELVAAARAGSREAAGELFERHWAAAWRAAYALTGGHAAERARAAPQRATASRISSEMSKLAYTSWTSSLSSSSSMSRRT
jgi:hypothetical protein